jgi:hypothetical protein
LLFSGRSTAAGFRPIVSLPADRLDSNAVQLSGHVDGYKKPHYARKQYRNIDWRGVNLDWLENIIDLNRDNHPSWLMVSVASFTRTQ